MIAFYKTLIFTKLTTCYSPAVAKVPAYSSYVSAPAVAKVAAVPAYSSYVSAPAVSKVVSAPAISYGYAAPVAKVASYAAPASVGRSSFFIGKILKLSDFETLFSLRCSSCQVRYLLGSSHQGGQLCFASHPGLQRPCVRSSRLIRLCFVSGSVQGRIRCPSVRHLLRCSR